MIYRTMIVNFLSQGARHTFSEAVGKNVANPTAMLLASANLLNHVNLQYYGDMIQNAVDRVIRVGKVSVCVFFFFYNSRKKKR